jgi:hypothetical protein
MISCVSRSSCRDFYEAIFCSFRKKVGFFGNWMLFQTYASSYYYMWIVIVIFLVPYSYFVLKPLSLHVLLWDSSSLLLGSFESAMYTTTSSLKIHLVQWLVYLISFVYFIFLSSSLVVRISPLRQISGVYEILIPAQLIDVQVTTYSLFSTTYIAMSKESTFFLQH